MLLRTREQMHACNAVSCEGVTYGVSSAFAGFTARYRRATLPHDRVTPELEDASGSSISLSPRRGPQCA